MIDERVRQELLLLREFGFTHLDLTSSATPAKGAGAAAPVSTSGAEPASEGVDSLAALTSEILACRSCRLCEERTNAVVGTGSPEADLMFIGEAPGRDEDLAGEPFVGRAGQLLTDIIKAMQFRREDVYIANVIKCRPPGNRNPEPDELDACRPFIHRQIELIAPRVIVTLGRFAYQSLTGDTAPISSIRGNWQEFRGIRLMPTYHPAYLLRNPAAKREVWSDMKLVMTELGKTAP